MKDNYFQLFYLLGLPLIIKYQVSHYTINIEMITSSTYELASKT